MCDDASEPLRNLEPIGEAATHIPSEVRAAHHEVPWSVIREAVPALLPALRRLPAETEKDHP